MTTPTIPPINVTASGIVPASPIDLRNLLIQYVSAINAGYTANLPATLIEDIASTDTGALVIIDQARVDLVNSVSPLTANEFILAQLAPIYGVTQGVGSNTSVEVVFTGTVGFVINKGFTVSDGVHQYAVQDTSIVGSSGQSAKVFCLATTAGSWAVPASTVTQLITSVPVSVTLTVTNPLDGVSGQPAQSVQDFRSQVIQAGLATAQGMPTFLRTQLQKISGVQTRLISIRDVGVNQWQIIVGGGDPFAVANAIFIGLFDITSLVGSSLDPLRNEVISINDFPDIYQITFVRPLRQAVEVDLLWNTISTNIVSAPSVSALAIPAIVSYINSIYVGNQPINIYDLQAIFINSISSIVSPALISTINITIKIDGIVTNPVLGTGIIYGSPEGYFETDTANVFVTKI
jgi:Baseplate J-like protein